jgi:aminoglycoside phosphotransferase (APT) family kinase protein
LEEQRPTPLVDDIEETRRRLAEWFSGRLQTKVDISTLRIPEATGMSNVTLLFDARWEAGGSVHSEACVGRLPPGTAKPVFPDYDLSLQYRIMSTLGENTDIPVPPLRGLETDPAILGVPFYIMRKVEGRIPTDMPPYNMDGWMLHETSPPQRAALWNAGLDMLARFHSLPANALAPGFMDWPDPPESALQQQLKYWRDYHDWAMEGREHRICLGALDWLEANQPRQEPTQLCWGDARIGNIIFSEDCRSVTALLDWEMAVAGNPVQDLAWYCYIDSTFAEGLGMPRLEGFPSHEDSVQRWRLATGHSVDDFGYYTIYAGMRYGLILSRIMVATGQESEIQGNFACRLLERRLEEL